jgi:hypothetical protein
VSVGDAVSELDLGREHRFRPASASCPLRTAFWVARWSSLIAASSDGKLPFVLIALRSCRFKASIALVVWITRRTSGSRP